MTEKKQFYFWYKTAPEDAWIHCDRDTMFEAEEVHAKVEKLGYRITIIRDDQETFTALGMKFKKGRHYSPVETTTGSIIHELCYV